MRHWKIVDQNFKFLKSIQLLRVTQNWWMGTPACDQASKNMWRKKFINFHNFLSIRCYFLSRPTGHLQGKKCIDFENFTIFFFRSIHTLGVSTSVFPIFLCTVPPRYRTHIPVVNSSLLVYIKVCWKKWENRKLA